MVIAMTANVIDLSEKIRQKKENEIELKLNCVAEYSGELIAFISNTLNVTGGDSFCVKYNQRAIILVCKKNNCRSELIKFLVKDFFATLKQKIRSIFK